MGEITQQNTLVRKSITEYQALGIAEDYKKRIFSMDWVFSSAFDKLFLVGLLSWSVYSAWRIFF